MKRCCTCKQEKPLAAFGKDKGRADGLYPACKECKNAHYREQYKASAEVRAYHAERRRVAYADPIKREAQKARSKRWNAEHYADPKYRERERARGKIYGHSPAGRAKAKRANAKAILKYQNNAEYRKRIRTWFAARYAKKRANGGTFTVEQWLFLLGLADGRCLRCGEVRKLTVDHIVPVSKGGRGDMDNVQPLCEHCNKSKGPHFADHRPPAFIAAVCFYQYR